MIPRTVIAVHPKKQMRSNVKIREILIKPKAVLTLFPFHLFVAKELILKAAKTEDAIRINIFIIISQLLTERFGMVGITGFTIIFIKRTP